MISPTLFILIIMGVMLTTGIFVAVLGLFDTIVPNTQECIDECLHEVDTSVPFRR